MIKMIDSISIENDIDGFLKEASLFINQNKYIGLKEYNNFIKKYSDILIRVEENKEIIEPKLYERVENAFKNQRFVLDKHNKKICEKKLIEYKEYFDNMFIDIDPSINLDKNQRKAIVADEDNLLIVAGAGSGKTTTMAAKVKYLIDKCNVKESEIAVISFTNKAVDEIRNRIRNDFGYKNVDVSTFHQLGLKILKSSGRDIVGIIDEGNKYKIISNYIKQQFENKVYFQKFVNAFKKNLSFKDDYNNFETFNDYHNYQYDKRLNDMDIKLYLEHEIKRRRDVKKTIKGEYTSSKEEVDIANFLFLNGIDYEYERCFDKKVGNNKFYKPDFYITQFNKHNYIEHFGIDENNNNSMYNSKTLEKYLDSLKVKTEFFNQPDNFKKFIVSYSKFKDGKSYEEHLKNNLLKFGYVLKSKTDNEIFQELKDTSQEYYFFSFVEKVVLPFISTFKGKNYNIDNFKELSEKADILGIEGQIDIMKDIYIHYQNELCKIHKIDFEDMINEAYQIMPKLEEANLNVDYNYIIIDEYQDISMQRYNLTKRISDLFNAKIMAVGDDWQSIFGFSGADINLFTNFQKYLKGAQMIPIENTYRNSQELIDIAGNFVLKNKDQLYKKLNSIKHLPNPIEIVKYNNDNKYISDTIQSKAVSNIIGKIYKDDPNKNILIMGRYKRDINVLLNCGFFTKKNQDEIICNSFPNAKITFLTIHSSKGLGYDNCILINMLNSKFGFPSKIEDEPIIKLLKPTHKEKILYPEERRLFYVAMTRTKNKLYIVIPNHNSSEFVDEIQKESNVLIHNFVININAPMSTGIICPDCGSKLICGNYMDTSYLVYYCKCGFITNTPKKLIRLNKCPICGQILIPINSGKKKFKCINNQCNY